MTKAKFITKEELTDEKLIEDFGGIMYDSYFICQYGIRKFLTDENVLFNESTPEEHKNRIKNIYGIDKITYRDIITNYNAIRNYIYYKIAPYEKLICFNLMKYSIYDKIILPGLTIIDNLQYFITFYNDEVFKNDKHLFISDIKVIDNWKLPKNNIKICSTLLKNKEFKKIMLLLNYISLRYGVMITSLYLEYFQITNCNKKLSFKELCAYCPFFSFKEHKKSHKEKEFQQNTLNNQIPFSEKIDLLVNEKISSDNSITSRDLIPYSNKVSNFFNSLMQGDKIKISDYKALKKEVQNIYSLSRSDKSLRRAGLVIWDILHNPMPLFEEIRKNNSITNPTEAANYIVSRGLYTNASNETPRMLNRHYNNTVACIKELTIIPVS